MNKQMSLIGVDFIDDVEGRKPFEYPDTEGNPTIGIGHLLTRSELTSGKILIGSNAENAELVKYRDGLSDTQMNNLLLMDLDPVEIAINKYVKVPLAQYQFDALCSLAMNIGVPAFVGSTLLKLLNQGKYIEVPAQMRRWNKSRNRKTGKLEVNKGLVNRRELDISLWSNLWRRKYLETVPNIEN